MLQSAGALAGLSEVADQYDALFCDVWGVVHNGIAAYPTAPEALQHFRRLGGRVVLITNAPRPSTPIIEMLDKLGVSRDAYDHVISSGDTTRVMIAPYAGRVVHHFGPAKIDDALYEGLGVIRGPAEEAEVVVCTDMPFDDDTPDMYEAEIELWLKRKLPLICANPDKFVEVGDKLIYCAGAMADIYAERGGEVLMAGKPYRPIYEEAKKLAESAAGRAIEPGRILAIGDSVRTDATGAANFGADLLFITGSIHAEELDAFGEPDPEAVRTLVAPSGANLAGFMPRLAW
ncbi:MAG TPA: TIGR01459 family HAD-type hydrolase [Devosiaceae bacterium]|nr:TIGR01459 family HAD-type hydrolase [Devosiaceae bacterium]